jgi:predicted nuclease of restriction endonuclease-like (RecB) superfamily
MSEIINNTEYKEFISYIKEKIRSSQTMALRAVNKELIELYWEIGHSIVKKQEEQKWGKSVVEILAHELQLEFPGSKGFSERNLWRMRVLYLTYNDNSKLTQLVTEIGWSHNLLVIERCNNNLEREYYIQMTRRNGWSRNTLATSIANQSYEKFLLSQHNFETALPEARQKDARLAIKDDYTFSFLDLEEDHLEKELERGLVDNIRKFLTEMGNYFTFVGSQYRIEVDGDEYFIDLLLYHRKLRCLVAIELKRDKFQPEFAGKMQFYLSALDDLVKLDGENPSIGIIVCQEKSRTKVEYTLKDLNKPIGIATYSASSKLPKEMDGLLPTEEEIAHHMKVFEK